MDAQRTHDGFLDVSVEVWRPRLARPLSRDDARQIASSVAGFCGVLIAWAEAEPCSRSDANAAATERHERTK